MKVDMKLLKELQSAGVKAAEFNGSGIVKVEFFSTAAQPPQSLQLPPGVPMDQVTMDVLRELTDEDRRKFEEKKREELLFHSS